MIVEPGQDLHVAAVGQRPVGEVRLPGLVGLFGGEPAQGRAGAFAWFGVDQAGGGDDPPDGRDRRGWVDALGGQVPGDGGRPGVQPVGDQFLSQFEDPGLYRLGGRPRVATGASGAGLEPVQPVGLVPGDEGVHPPP